VRFIPPRTSSLTSSNRFDVIRPDGLSPIRPIRIRIRRDRTTTTTWRWHLDGGSRHRRGGVARSRPDTRLRPNTDSAVPSGTSPFRKRRIREWSCMPNRHTESRTDRRAVHRWRHLPDRSWSSRRIRPETRQFAGRSPSTICNRRRKRKSIRSASRTWKECRRRMRTSTSKRADYFRDSLLRTKRSKRIDADTETGT